MSATPTQDQRTPQRERGWLIEEKDSDGEPVYWTVDATGAESFTDNHREAVRFARREDADKVRGLLIPPSLARSVEHMWEVTE